MITLHGELLLPYALLQARQPRDVEAWLQAQGVLPAQADERRWRLATERSGYVLTYTVPLVLTPPGAGG